MTRHTFMPAAGLCGILFRPAAVLALSLGTAAQAQAQATGERIVITGSRLEQLEAEAPYAVTVIDGQQLRDAGPMVNLSEALVRVPGLVVNNRNNYAQDLQMSSRGFGSRAGFGVRGLRLYSDGIPSTMPDGQGQVAHFDLAGAERVEVLRGPWSVIYGNSSGGVISLFTGPVRRGEAEVGVDVGSFGLRQYRLSAAAPLGERPGRGLDVRMSASTLEIDGFRPQSAARRDLFNIRLGWTGERDRVVVVASDFDQPADDPLGLTPEDWAADPRQTAQVAKDFDVRKQARQHQLGASWVRAYGDGLLRESQLAGYVGQRSVTQWQSIPVIVQTSNPGHGGGVVDFDRQYRGLEARLRWKWQQLDLITGVALDEQTDDRRGYENFTGTPPNRVLGVTGRLRRDEENTARSRDAYVQGEWAFTPTVSASAGVRSGRVTMRSTDFFIDTGNADDSGERSFSYTNPVLGLKWMVRPGWQVHASVGRGYESPTLGELAYRPDGAGGFNEALKAQRSRQWELGTKWRSAAVDVDAALFRADADDEIGVLTNSGGRSTFQNVGSTRRQGLELSTTWRLAPAWRTQFTGTWLDATYTDGFTGNAGPVPAGNRIAGTQRRSGWAELVWSGGAWGEAGLEWRGVGSTAVNDLNTFSAPGYALANLRWTKGYTVGDGKRLELLVRVDNLADRDHVGSVIVNDGNRRWYETGTPRSVLLALRLQGNL